MSYPPLADWEPFLSVSAGIAATLTGLVFVAASLNLQRILQTPGLTSLVAESLVQLLGAAMLALLLIVPHQSYSVLGWETLGLVVFLWFFQLRLQVRYLRADTGHPRRWGVRRILRTFFSCLPFLVAAFLFLRDSQSGFYWVVAGILLSITAGVANAWVLLVDIVR